MTIELEKKLRIPFPMGIMDLDIDHERNLAYAACMDGIYQCQLTASDEKDRPKPFRIGVHNSYVSGISIGKKSGIVATASYDGSIHIRDLPNEAVQTEIAAKRSEKVHSFWSWGMALSPDEKWIASVTGQYLAGAEDYTPLASKEPCVKLLDASTGQLAHSWDMLPSVQCVTIDSKSQYVAAGNLMGDLAVWDISTGKQLSAWRTPSFTSWGIIKSHCYFGGIYSVSFSPDGEYLYAAGMGEMGDPMAGNGKQRWQKFAWKHEKPVKVGESKQEQTGEGLMETLAWDPSGELFAMAGRLRGGNWNIGVFHASSGDLVGQAKTGMRITSAQFSPDGQSLYLAGMQGQPSPKDGHFPAFGYLERYEIKPKT